MPAGRSQASVRRLGTTTHDGCCEDTYSALLQRFQRSEEELRAVAAEWLQCQKRIDAYVDEQVRAREGRAGRRARGCWGWRAMPGAGGAPSHAHGLGHRPASVPPAGTLGAALALASCWLTLPVQSLGAHGPRDPQRRLSTHAAASEREHRPGPGGRVQRGEAGHRLSGSTSWLPPEWPACLPRAVGAGRRSTRSSPEGTG